MVRFSAYASAVSGILLQSDSFFYCYDEAGRIHSILGEVHNTFGEIRNYWLSAENRQADGNAFRYVCPKTLHVSPFNPMNLDYEFVLTQPGDRLVAHMSTAEGSDKPFFDATLTLEHRAWTSRNLARRWRDIAHDAQVIGAIHWEALRLWIKRVPVFTHPDRIEPQSRGGNKTAMTFARRPCSACWRISATGLWRWCVRTGSGTSGMRPPGCAPALRCTTRLLLRLLWGGDDAAGMRMSMATGLLPTLSRWVRLAARNLAALEGGNPLFSVASRLLHRCATAGIATRRQAGSAIFRRTTT